jgi:hypothetical protein
MNKYHQLKAVYKCLARKTEIECQYCSIMLVKQLDRRLALICSIEAEYPTFRNLKNRQRTGRSLFYIISSLIEHIFQTFTDSTFDRRRRKITCFFLSTRECKCHLVDHIWWRRIHKMKQRFIAK